MCRQTNGGNWEDKLLTGSIAPNTTYVAANYNDNTSDYFYQNFGFMADYDFGGSSGNGDDGYFLYSGGNHTSGTLIDAYGVIDEDGSGKAWEYEDTKAVRKRLDTIPSATWHADSWVINTTANDEDMTPDWHKRTLNWTGAVSSDWGNKDNWEDDVNSVNLEPDAGCKVVVPQTANPPVVSSDITVGSLKLDTNATITVSSGTLQVLY